MPELTVERLRELLDYDPTTGYFTWRVARSRVAKGSRAGSKKAHGYILICIDEKYYYAHRLAWFITRGAWPIEQIDHFNGVGDDNRIVNLREASRSLNLQNQRVPRSDNASGYLGVYWESDNKAFRAIIRIQGKQRHLGYFTDPAEAHQAYLTAKRKHHAGCTI